MNIKILIPLDKLTVDSFFPQSLWNNKYFTYAPQKIFAQLTLSSLYLEI